MPDLAPFGGIRDVKPAFSARGAAPTLNVGSFMGKLVRIAVIAVGVLALQASSGAFAQSNPSSSSSSTSGATSSQAIPSAPSAPSTSGAPPSTAAKPTDPCPSGQMLAGTPPKCVAVSGVKK
jgi:cytoskeletal protein RodZ